MKKILVTLFVLQSIGLCAQDSLNMGLLHRWDDSTVWQSYNWGGMWQQYNEIWGWADSASGNEYAIIGSAEGTYIFNVTDPTNTVMSDFELGKDTAEIHRDFKTYKHYLYGVADEGNSSLQIFDMSYLPDSVHKVYDSDTFCIRSHNIFIDEGILYICTPAISGAVSHLRIMDLTEDPANPKLLGDLMLTGGQGNHVHDLFVRDKIAYCSNGNSGLHIYDVSDPANVTHLQSITSYSDQGYNHSSWLSEDSKTMFFVDENLGHGIKAYDITDLNDMDEIALFRSNSGSMPHNVFVHGYKLYVSYYHDGVWVFDVADPANPLTIGYYDTYEEASYTSYQGCWGVYPYLPSGNIIASDFSNGLFVLSDSTEADTTRIPVIGGIADSDKQLTVQVFPNPVANRAMLNIPSGIKVEQIEIRDVTGRIVYKESFTADWRIVDLPIQDLTDGTYFVNAYESKNSNPFVTKFVKK